MYLNLFIMHNFTLEKHMKKLRRLLSSTPCLTVVLIRKKLLWLLHFFIGLEVLREMQCDIFEFFFEGFLLILLFNVNKNLASGWKFKL